MSAPLENLTREEKLDHLIQVSDFNAQALHHLCTTFDQIVGALMASPMGAMIGKSINNA